MRTSRSRLYRGRAEVSNPEIWKEGKEFPMLWTICNAPASFLIPLGVPSKGEREPAFVARSYRGLRRILPPYPHRGLQVPDKHRHLVRDGRLQAVRRQYSTPLRFPTKAPVA